MDPLTGLDLQWMKNYQGQIGLVPSRMLQYISLPFGTRTLLLLKEGVKLDIAFTKRELFNQNGHEHFDDMTPVLVMKQYINEDGQTAGTNHVVDVDLNRARGVEDSVLERPFARSWDVLINPERLADTFEHNLRYNGYSDANYNTRRLWYNAVSLSSLANVPSRETS